MNSESIPFVGGGILVWGAFLSLYQLGTGKSSNDCSKVYCKMFRDHVAPYAQLMGPDFILIYDNPRPHIDNIVSGYLNDVGVASTKTVLEPNRASLGSVDNSY